MKRKTPEPASEPVVEISHWYRASRVEGIEYRLERLTVKSDGSFETQTIKTEVKPIIIRAAAMKILEGAG